MLFPFSLSIKNFDDIGRVQVVDYLFVEISQMTSEATRLKVSGDIIPV